MTDPSGTYVTRPGDPFAGPPYGVVGAGFTDFVLPSSYSALNALLDDELGAVTGGAYRFYAVLPVVIVTYVAIERSLSLSAPQPQQGYYSENDLMCWLLVAAVRKGDLLPEQIGWYTPFVWVDHPVAFSEGREGLGYPKSLGTITIPRPGAPADYSCSAWVFPGSPDEELTVSTVCSVAGNGSGIAEEWAGFADVRQALLDAAAVEDASAHAFDESVHAVDLSSALSLTQVVFLLRQFRSASNPTRALCQEIVTQPFAGVSFHSAGRLSGSWQVAFPPQPALSVASTLGIAASGEPLLAAQLSLDCTLGAASTLWSLGG